MKAWPWWLALAFALGLLGGWWARRPDPVAVARIDAILSDTARVRGELDSLRGQVVRLQSFRVDTTPAERVGRTLRQSRRDAPVVGTIVPILGMDTTVAMVPLATYEAVVEEADSAWAALEQEREAGRVRADSAGRAFAAYDSTSRAALARLTAGLVEARRNIAPRKLFGFLPMPVLTCGYGVVLAAGRVATAPGCQVGVRVGI